MIVVLGVILLIAAAIIVTVGALANSGSAHELATDSFSIFGYHVSGSTGTLLLYGVVFGAVGMLGLAMILAGARRGSRRGRAARRDLKRADQRVEALGRDRDELLGERNTTGTQSSPSRSSSHSWRHPLGSRA